MKKLITNPDMINTSFNTPLTLREREKREKDRERGRREREREREERKKEERRKRGREETGREKERFIHSVTQSVSPFKVNY